MHLQDAIGIKTCILCDSGMYEIWTVKQVVDPELNTKMCVLLSKDCAGITLLQHKRNTHSMTTYTVLPCRNTNLQSSNQRLNTVCPAKSKCHQYLRWLLRGHLHNYAALIPEQDLKSATGGETRCLV